MKIKYQKPLARNLGDNLLFAEGECRNGSAANGQGRPPCVSGGSASGNYKCNTGSGAVAIACVQGSKPDQSIAGCLTGTLPR